MLSLLGPHFQRIVLTQFTTNRRSRAVIDLVKLAGELLPPESHWTVAETPAEAWREVQRELSANEMVIATGSFFLAAELRPLMVPAAVDLAGAVPGWETAAAEAGVARGVQDMGRQVPRR